MSVAHWGVSFRRAGAEDRSLALVLATGAAASLLFVPLVPRIAPFVPACALHALTGVPCPACGTTRALVALAQGDPWRALGWNPLATASIVVLSAACILLPLWVALKQPLPRFAPVLPWRTRGAMVALLTLNWAWLVARGV